LIHKNDNLPNGIKIFIMSGKNTTFPKIKTCLDIFLYKPKKFNFNFAKN